MAENRNLVLPHGEATHHHEGEERAVNAVGKAPAIGEIAETPLRQMEQRFLRPFDKDHAQEFYDQQKQQHVGCRHGEIFCAKAWNDGVISDPPPKSMAAWPEARIETAKM